MNMDKYHMKNQSLKRNNPDVGAPACPVLVYFGTHFGPPNQGVYLSRFDEATGQLSTPELAADVVNPSFMAFHPTRALLYTVSLMKQANGTTAGAVSAFSFCSETGKLTRLNQVASGGTGPCHLIVDRTGQCVLVANYSSGSVAAIAVRPDGCLVDKAAVSQHAGASVDPVRQEGPHVHSVNLDAANRLAFVADLGLDKIFIYRFDPEKATLTPHDLPAIAVKPGSGPRHLAWHSSGRFAYVSNELSNTVSVFRHDPERGLLTELQTISTLPSGIQAQNTVAEIQIHPSGRFLYVSNRGHDSLAVFALDREAGTLTPVAIEPCGGHWPRHFAFDAAGNWMLVANERADSITVLRVDQTTGRLQFTGQSVTVPAPVCVKFLPRP